MANNRIAKTFVNKKVLVLVPITFDSDQHQDLLRHRHITGVPTVRLIRALLTKEKQINPKDFGVKGDGD